MSKRKQEERDRFTAERKADAVLRLRKGEDLDAISWEFGVAAAMLSSWREAFLAGADAGLKTVSGIR